LYLNEDCSEKVTSQMWKDFTLVVSERDAADVETRRIPADSI
jgi:hypothetical protein